MKKQGWILIAITGAFLCLLLGVFLGRSANKSYIQIQDASAPTTQSEQSVSPVKININTATIEQLKLLNGIGNVTAQKIIVYRESNGDFAKIEDLMKVSGIGEKTFANIKDYITVD